MNRYIGAILCRFLYRGHADRRLRKGESVSLPLHIPPTAHGIRICARCGRVRAVKARRKA